MVPEGIREVQDDEEWDIELQDDAADRQAADGARQQDGDSAMSGAMRDRAGRDAARDQRSGDGDVSEARKQRREMHREARGERRDRLVRMGLAAAKRAYPDAEFQRYRFDVEDGRRVVQILGTHPDTDRRIQIDVGTDGRIREIAERVALESVPESVRRVVRSEIGPMRVAHASRAVRWQRLA